MSSNFNGNVKKTFFFSKNFSKFGRKYRKITKNRYRLKLKVTNSHKKTLNHVGTLFFCDAVALPPISTCVAILAVLDIFSDQKRAKKHSYRQSWTLIRGQSRKRATKTTCEFNSTLYKMRASI